MGPICQPRARPRATSRKTASEVRRSQFARPPLPCSTTITWIHCVCSRPYRSWPFTIPPEPAGDGWASRCSSFCRAITSPRSCWRVSRTHPPSGATRATSCCGAYSGWFRYTCCSSPDCGFYNLATHKLATVAGDLPFLIASGKPGFCICSGTSKAAIRTLLRPCQSPDRCPKARHGLSVAQAGQALRCPPRSSAGPCGAHG